MFKHTFSLILAGGLILSLMLSVAVNVIYEMQGICVASAVVRPILVHVGLGFFSIILPAALFYHFH